MVLISCYYYTHYQYQKPNYKTKSSAPCETFKDAIKNFCYLVQISKIVTYSSVRTVRFKNPTDFEMNGVKWAFAQHLLLKI